MNRQGVKTSPTAKTFTPTLPVHVIGYIERRKLASYRHKWKINGNTAVEKGRVYSRIIIVENADKVEVYGTFEGRKLAKVWT